jgi:beta-N-acetylhexosaminidase
MNKKNIAFIFLFFLYLQNIYAQNSTNADSLKFVRWQDAEQKICLLENKNTIIPIKQLDKKTIACISFGNDTLNIFNERLSDYASIDYFNIQKTESDTYYNKVKNKLKSYNLIICSLHCLDNNQRMANGLTKQMGRMIQYFGDSTNAVVVIFGNTQAINELQGIEKVNALIYTPSKSSEYQDLAAQLIFGGIGAKGKLNEDINSIYKKGFGLESESGIRFKFTFPEELGIDGASLRRKIDSIAENGIRQKAYPGCQVLAAKDGKIFFHKTYGFHTYDSIIPVRKTDLYDLASITKITGPLPVIMKLYDEGKIKLDSKFAEYWPAFKNSDKKDITLREALTHQAGFVPSISFWKKTLMKNGKFKRHTFKAGSSKNYPVKLFDDMYLHKKYYKKIYKTIKKTKLKDKREYLYSDISFLLYPKIIENLTSENFEEYISKNFYKSLGANSITYNPLKKYDKNRIIPTEYDSVFRKKLVHGYVHDESAAMLGGISGNAGLFCTTLDLAKMMQMYLNMGRYGGQQFISDTTMKEFTRCQFPKNNNRRGLGFDKPLLKNKEKGSVAPSASDNSFGHTGFTGTLCWADPDTGILYIFMSNRIYPTRNNSKIFELNIRPSIHQAIYDALINKKSTN